MKRLVACLDGTWNRPGKEARSTNVVKIMRAIRATAQDGTKQITFYDKGVGTSGKVDSLLGGAFGRGLGENVKDGYRFLGNNYEAGDEIYLFGFSRGAFTARSLAGFIAACGLLDKNSLGKLEEAWDLYRIPPARRPADAVQAMQALGHGAVEIRCIGVWDTVGALGIPGETLRWVNRGRYEFHDTELGAGVKVALHALAIDEKRGPFAPTLWQSAAPRPGQTVEQVWFPGVHSNIGGGYAETGLSDGALSWMIYRVDTLTPLDFDYDYLNEFVKPDPMGEMVENRKALYAFSRAFPYQRVIGEQGSWVRKVMPRWNKPAAGMHFVGEKLHASALKRYGKAAPEMKGQTRREKTYAPESVKAAKGRVVVVSADNDRERDR